MNRLEVTTSPKFDYELVCKKPARDARACVVNISTLIRHRESGEGQGFYPFLSSCGVASGTVVGPDSSALGP